MPHPNSPFDPNTINEHIAHTLNTQQYGLPDPDPNAQLIANVYHSYQNDQQRLNNVWQRLSQRMEKTSDNPHNNTSKISYLTPLPIAERNTAMTQPPSSTQVSNSKKSRWFAPISVLAATILILCSIAIFTLTKPHTNTGQPSPKAGPGIYQDYEGMLKVDPLDGHILWQHKFNDTSYNGIFADQKSQTVYTFNTTNNTLYALNTNDGSTTWKSKLPSRIYGRSHNGLQNVTQDSLYVVGDYGVYKLNKHDGTLQYTYKPRSTGTPPNQMFVVAKDNIIFIAEANLFYAIDTTNNNELWRKTSPQDTSFYQPSINNDILYIRSTPDSLPSTASLQAFKLTGEQLWQTQEPTAPSFKYHSYYINFLNNVIYTETNNILSAYNAKDGTRLWQKTNPTNIDDCIVNTNGIYCVDTGKQKGDYPLVISLNLQTGEKLWTFDPVKLTNDSLHYVFFITVSNDTLYVVSFKGNLYSVNKKGTSIWKTKIPAIRI